MSITELLHSVKTSLTQYDAGVASLANSPSGRKTTTRAKTSSSHALRPCLFFYAFFTPTLIMIILYRGCFMATRVRIIFIGCSFHCSFFVNAVIKKIKKKIDIINRAMERKRKKKNLSVGESLASPGMCGFTVISRSREHVHNYLNCLLLSTPPKTRKANLDLRLPQE